MSCLAFHDSRKRKMPREGKQRSSGLRVSSMHSSPRASIISSGADTPRHLCLSIRGRLSTRAKQFKGGCRTGESMQIEFRWHIHSAIQPLPFALPSLFAVQALFLFQNASLHSDSFVRTGGRDASPSVEKLVIYSLVLDPDGVDQKFAIHVSREGSDPSKMLIFLLQFAPLGPARTTEVSWGYPDLDLPFPPYRAWNRKVHGYRAATHSSLVCVMCPHSIKSTGSQSSMPDAPVPVLLQGGLTIYSDSSGSHASPEHAGLFRFMQEPQGLNCSTVDVGLRVVRKRVFTFQDLMSSSPPLDYDWYLD
ncbi:hypothetical protein CIHG_03114 [Coccidioides immitis H538.4]|uniref:Uncharacterized protein n=2 Tax=Coccidioides immitis TaxID=5501 RepID=A0A0J8RJJ1_COCIT|nr:hypothetical protein CIRG_00810 [Coccidioides immitis RMSCC 2394]KMU85330.1 hypothetical protein CIHG_03114 [Coccidioides immitis H538.4]